MQFYRTTREDGRLIVEPTGTGRLAHAVIRFVTWGPIAMAGLSLLFMPDYVCQYREQEPVAGMFWMVMAATAAFVAGIGAFVKYSRRDVWMFDAEADEITFRADPLFGAPAEATEELSGWMAMHATRSAMPARSTIEIGFEEHPPETLGESRFGWGPLEEIWDELVAFIDDNELDVDLDEGPSG